MSDRKLAWQIRPGGMKLGPDKLSTFAEGGELMPALDEQRLLQVTSLHSFLWSLCWRAGLLVRAWRKEGDVWGIGEGLGDYDAYNDHWQNCGYVNPFGLDWVRHSESFLNRHRTGLNVQGKRYLQSVIAILCEQEVFWHGYGQGVIPSLFTNFLSALERFYVYLEGERFISAGPGGFTLSELLED